MYKFNNCLIWFVVVTLLVVIYGDGNCQCGDEIKVYSCPETKKSCKCEDSMNDCGCTRRVCDETTRTEACSDGTSVTIKDCKCIDIDFNICIDGVRETVYHFMDESGANFVATPCCPNKSYLECLQLSSSIYQQRLFNERNGAWSEVDIFDPNDPCPCC